MENQHMEDQHMQKVLQGFYSFTNFETRRVATYNVNNFSCASISMLLKYLGNPQNSFVSVHVAGTKGKGSVVSMLAAAMSSMGIKTGEYLSPHVLIENERFRLDGQMASTKVLLPHLQATLNAAQQLLKIKNPNKGNHIFSPTLFDLLTAAAFLLFKNENVQLAVVETGLGGRLDSTNILRPAISVITRIDLDHTEKLGKTLAAIAKEKAGIIKPYTKAVYLNTSVKSARTIMKAAKNVLAPLFTIPSNGNYKNIEPEILKNFYLALEPWLKFGCSKNFNEIARQTSLPSWHRENLNLVLGTLFVLALDEAELPGFAAGGMAEVYEREDWQVIKKKLRGHLQKYLMPKYGSLKHTSVQAQFLSSAGEVGEEKKAGLVKAAPLFLRAAVQAPPLFGRYTLLRNFLFDGAHTVNSLQALVKSVSSDERLGGYSRIVCVFFALADKDIEAMVNAIPTAWELVFFNPQLFYLPKKYEGDVFYRVNSTRRKQKQINEKESPENFLDIPTISYISELTSFCNSDNCCLKQFTKNTVQQSMQKKVFAKTGDSKDFYWYNECAAVEILQWAYNNNYYKNKNSDCKNTLFVCTGSFKHLRPLAQQLQSLNIKKNSKCLQLLR